VDISGLTGGSVTLSGNITDAGTGLSGLIDNNRIGVSNVVDSATKTANGIFFSYAGIGTASVTITTNEIRNWHNNGAIYADNTGGSYTANFKIKGNTIAEPGAGSFTDLGITDGANTSSDTINVCAEIGGPTAGEKNISSGPTGKSDIYHGCSGANSGHTFNLPGLTSPFTLAHVATFVAGNNTINAGSTLTYQVYDDNGGNGIFTGVGTGCGTP